MKYFDSNAAVNLALEGRKRPPQSSVASLAVKCLQCGPHGVSVSLAREGEDLTGKSW